MGVTYKALSGVYDLLDVLYFYKGLNPRKALVDAIPDSPVNILDMCTGTATNSLQIAKNRSQAKIVGIDISPEMLNIAKAKIQEEKLEGVEVMQADACSTPFSDNSFDFVVLALVLHEIDDGLAKNILQEAYRVLKDTGYLLVLEWEQPTELMKRIKFASIKVLEPKPFKTFITCNKKYYFQKHRFQIIEEKHCDYSCVYKMQKIV